MAGRDLQAGGTWLGVRGHRWAALTNFREPGARPSPGLRSRGELVTDFLAGQESPHECASRLAGAGEHYAGYNFLCGEGSDIYYQSNRTPGSVAVAAGYHGLSNALLDTPWPKVVRGRAALEGRSEPEELLEVLADAEPAPDAQLPDTGVGLDLERKLSPLFLNAVGGYGTRCSSVLRLDSQGQWLFHERRFLADGTREDSRFFSGSA